MKTLQPTEEIRAKLRLPLGKLIEGSPTKTMRELRKLIGQKKPPKIFAVGDTVTSSMINRGIKANLYIIDNKIMRKPIKPLPLRVEREAHVKNPPGKITAKAWETVEEAANQDQTVKIVVEGEEDLLTIPAAISAQKGTFVIYGQPHTGIVLVEVTNEKKKELMTIVDAMKKLEE